MQSKQNECVGFLTWLLIDTKRQCRLTVRDSNNHVIFPYLCNQKSPPLVKPLLFIYLCVLSEIQPFYFSFLIHGSVKYNLLNIFSLNITPIRNKRGSQKLGLEMRSGTFSSFAEGNPNTVKSMTKCLKILLKLHTP